MKILILTFFALSFTVHAQDGCSLTFAKKVARGVFELQVENNNRGGKISFERGSNSYGLQTFEYTEELLNARINDPLAGEQTTQKHLDLLKTLTKRSGTRLYRVKQRLKVGEGKCGLSATCQGSIMLVETLERDGDCFVESVTTPRY
jgi:hypothetical protein